MIYVGVVPVKSPIVTNMKKVIVTTTINPVTEAIKRFQAMEDWDLVVVGDKKTPADYKLERGVYLNPDNQESYDKELSDSLGWNCIERRNFGFLWAFDMGADIVATVDDDNIPYQWWGDDLLIGKQVEVNYFNTDLPVFDPIGATNEKRLWHRGYPLELIHKRDYSRKERRTVDEVSIQADFWNGDPDIDAFCRMEHAPECEFTDEYFPIAANKISPFNSQNTFIKGSLLKDYFMFPDVGRQHDIWASYYLLSKGHNIVYNKASVFQKRNEHDLIKDLESEYNSYINTMKLIESLAADSESFFDYLSERAIRSFELYRRHFV